MSLPEDYQAPEEPEFAVPPEAIDEVLSEAASNKLEAEQIQQTRHHESGHPTIARNRLSARADGILWALEQLLPSEQTSWESRIIEKQIEIKAQQRQQTDNGLEDLLPTEEEEIEPAG